MPVLHERYPCHVCNKTHALYFSGENAPELHKQFYYNCPSNGFAVRITKADGWKPVDARPKGSLRVDCGDGAGRAEA